MARILKFTHFYVISFLMFVSAGCAHKSPWQYQQMVSCAPEYQSSKLTLPPPNPFNGIGIELIQREGSTRGFFNVHAGHMSSDEGVIWINNQPICFKGTLMEGNQRLLLPAAITRDIIQALTERQSVTASVPGYVTTLSELTAQTALKFKELSSFL